MSESNNLPKRGNVFSANDAFDINELASLNDDITPEFIEQLQNQLTANTLGLEQTIPIEVTDDTQLFEEVKPESEVATPTNNIEDEFEKKFKAKQKNKQEKFIEAETIEKNEETPDKNNIDNAPVDNEASSAPIVIKNEINEVTGGNITEKPISQEQIEYNESLNYIDSNKKYSKYVIYIDQENTEFIESLTVKERKNLINKLLREQDDIAITKRRLNSLHTIAKHSIVAIITVAIAIPIIYSAINASLEATINNHRRSQAIFQTLYKEKGKVQSSIR